MNPPTGALHQEFARYIAAGTLAFLSDFAVFLTLTSVFDVHYLAANAAAFCLGLTVSYLCCITWVFSQRTYSKVSVELPVFIAVSGVMLFVGEVLMLVLVEFATLSTVAAKIVMTGIVFVGNFLLKKSILFRQKTK